MPQLDKLTFFSQFFWLSFFFLGFYISLVKYYLPKMSKILKVRNIKVSSSQEGFSDVKKENGLVRENVDNLVVIGLKHSKQFFQESFQKTSDWVLGLVESTNKGSFQKMNHLYLSTLGNGFSSQALFFHQFKNLVAPRSFSLWTQDFLHFSGKNRQEKLYNFRIFKRLSRKAK